MNESQRLAARAAVARAIRRGELVPQPCHCGKIAEAHHPNGYEPAAWLDVEWLCRRHHRAVHVAMRAGQPKHRPFSEIRRPMTPARRERVGAITRIMEAGEHLVALRLQAGMTQAEVADRLDGYQASVSIVERSDDMLMSTLRGYVEALGYELAVTAVFPDGRRIRLVLPAP